MNVRFLKITGGVAPPPADRRLEAVWRDAGTAPAHRAPCAVHRTVHSRVRSGGAGAAGAPAHPPCFHPSQQAARKLLRGGGRKLEEGWEEVGGGGGGGRRWEKVVLPEALEVEVL